MALKKDIILSNGISLNYHRILSIKSIINVSTEIVVLSYVNENKRLEEKNEESNEYIDNGIETDVIEIPYQDMKIDDAYKYLLTLDKYKNAKDC